MQSKKSHPKGELYLSLEMTHMRTLTVCLFLLRTLSPENRKVNRSSHNTQGKKDVESAESMYGLRNNSASSALKPSSRGAVGHHSDGRVAKRRHLQENATNVADDLVDNILNVSFMCNNEVYVLRISCVRFL